MLQSEKVWTGPGGPCIVEYELNKFEHDWGGGRGGARDPCMVTPKMNKFEHFYGARSVALYRVGRGVGGTMALCMVWLFQLLTVKPSCTGNVCQYSSFRNVSSINVPFPMKLIYCIQRKPVNIRLCSLTS